ncbi:hypothetical protein H2201_004569 [Coniosporium apollinis]|uniref:DUF676 domain-containing protein n=1 Tax=Coniosporium apollinis TaxID=61459 RepID=A0ABQ9NT30_9PEZI|nr:hypothetical protein H2201_004569 [Coniosporium apollinis]
MKRTLLLVFIHGFKGGEGTFRDFPQHLQALLSHALPKVTVTSIIYPRFETRGDLHDCVARFKEWLQNKVIDLEVANGTPSPTVEPGIVAAEALLSILSEKPIHPDSTTVANNGTSTTRPTTPNPTNKSSNPVNLTLPTNTKLPGSGTTTPKTRSRSTSTVLPPDPTTLVFPFIQGILAFDTPYLGISPSVIAHGAEEHFNAASSAWSAYNSMASAFGWGGSKSGTQSPAVDASRALPAAGVETQAQENGWQKFGRVALLGAGVVAAGGAAAYLGRDKVTEGWSWVGSHLEFIGCLARGEDLKKRLVAVVQVSETRGVGFAVFYTTLGKAVEGKDQWSTSVVGKERTFCTIPREESRTRKYWVEARNDRAMDEIAAHVSMFGPRENPGFYGMSDQAKDAVVSWCKDKWYEEGDEEGASLLGEEGEKGTESRPKSREGVEAKEKRKAAEQKEKAKGVPESKGKKPEAEAKEPKKEKEVLEASQTNAEVTRDAKAKLESEVDANLLRPDATGEGQEPVGDEKLSGKAGEAVQNPELEDRMDIDNLEARVPGMEAPSVELHSETRKPPRKLRRKSVVQEDSKAEETKPEEDDRAPTGTENTVQDPEPEDKMEIDEAEVKAPEPEAPLMHSRTETPRPPRKLRRKSGVQGESRVEEKEPIGDQKEPGSVDDALKDPEPKDKMEIDEAEVKAPEAEVKAPEAEAPLVHSRPETPRPPRKLRRKSELQDKKEGAVNDQEVVESTKPIKRKPRKLLRFSDPKELTDRPESEKSGPEKRVSEMAAAEQAVPEQAVLESAIAQKALPERPSPEKHDPESDASVSSLRRKPPKLRIKSSTQNLP